MTGRTIELTWVCTSCGHRNLGRHKACEGCGDPKDASERFEMPSDTRAAASVQDPALLRAAAAGRDWRCTFCRADNRALDARCVQCGAGRDGTPPIARAQPQIGPTRAPRGSARWALALVPLALGVACLVGAGALAMLRRPAPAALAPPGPEIVSAQVEAREWQTRVVAMRRRLVEREGFREQIAADAVDIRERGARHHHDDQVPDGTTEETYFEDVPYQDVETYTEMVPCGEDCVPIPQTCREECTDEGNGFASCHDVCVGGGQSCTPRSCPETRTRSVTRTRPEARTRTVPRFRAVPRDAPWFGWREWAWVEDRRAERSGGVEAPSWPSDEELGAGEPLGEGEDERLDRMAIWSVSARHARGGSVTFTPPTLEDLSRYPVGGALRVELDAYGGFTRVIDDAERSGL